MANLNRAAQQVVVAALDFIADIEIDGTEVTQGTIDVSDTGDNTVYTPASGKRVKVYRVGITPNANVTGAIILKIGSTSKWKVNNPRTNSEYGPNLNPNYMLGAADEAVKVNLPAGAGSVTVNYAVEEVD